MFEERALDGEVDSVRDRHAPDAVVLDCQRDFETLDPAVAEDLLLLTEGLDPLSYPDEWVPADAPDELHRFAGSDFTIGMPGDGGVAWTRQTDPAVVLVKPRLAGSPDDFVDFLLAEALVQVGLDLPEHFLGFFEDRYPDFSRAVAGRLDPAGTYQLAAAAFDAYVGLHSREVFADWDGDLPRLFDAWHDAGERLEPRLGDLSEEIALGRTEFSAAAELACSAVKHALEPPAPFAALDTSAYREYGAEYAVRWAEKTLQESD
ncbi:DUF7089 family protein [Halomicrobium urmianum]|uniref:DUF7089 family protein n=1 Tax=Halomicrobium urmianum TaxID=1586233 RepID=UPI001CD9E339|nr:hypothetical protein [Halomicrobium urmianum]